MYVHIAGVAKKVLPNQPYIVANELICNGIARALMLPCPPGALMQQSADVYFFTLDFNVAGQALPPIDASALVAAHPRLAWGVIAFDALVMNGDRHTKNIAHDLTTGEVQIFDHSHALLTPSGDIQQNMAARQNSLSIGGHCLAKEINTLDGMDYWIERIKQIPDYVIDELITSACKCGIPQSEHNYLTTFIKERRNNMEQLLTQNIKASFPKIPTV